MSNYLSGLSQLNPLVKRHNGGTTTLTLDENGTTNATLLFVNGVAQTPGIDFNVSGATLTATSTLPAGTNICTTIQYFNTGIVNTVADNAIGLGQMASGVDGNVISYDANGNPVAVATGNDGQVLTSTGAGSPPAFETPAGGGAWTLINSATASNASTLTITGLDSSTYATHGIFVQNMFPSDYNVRLMMRVGNSSGVITSSTYYYHVSESSDGGGNSYSAQSGEGNATPYICLNVGDVAAKGGCGATIYLCPNDGVRYPRWYGTYVAGANNGNGNGGQLVGTQHGATNVDRLQFLFSAGTIISGRVSVYGIAHA